MRLACALLAASMLVAGCQAQESGPAVARPPSGTQRSAFDHSLHNEIMRTYVTEDGLLDYKALQSRHSDTLKAYLESLAAAGADRFAGPDDELAFWLNAYNAFVIAGVLEHYPGIESVMDFPDFFKAKRWEAAGKQRSLDEIENEIIRPRFKDPRIHFVLVCAAQDCPQLPARAMTAETVHADLEHFTRQAVNNSKYVEVDSDGRKLHLTKIMQWYKKDFVEKDGSLEAFLLRYLDEPARGQLAADGYTVEFKSYDWRLNDVDRPATR
jgi:hypothetical protein